MIKDMSAAPAQRMKWTSPSLVAALLAACGEQVSRLLTFVQLSSENDTSGAARKIKALRFSEIILDSEATPFRSQVLQPAACGRTASARRRSGSARCA